MRFCVTSDGFYQLRANWSHLQWSVCLSAWIWNKQAALYVTRPTHCDKWSFHCTLTPTCFLRDKCSCSKYVSLTFFFSWQVSWYVSCQTSKARWDLKQQGDISKKWGFHTKGVPLKLATRAFPRLFINLPNISTVSLLTTFSLYVSQFLCSLELLWKAEEYFCVTIYQHLSTCLSGSIRCL